MKRPLLGLLMSLAVAAAAPSAGARAEDEGDGPLRFPSSGRGSIEFTVKPLRGEFSALKDILLMRAASSDGAERYEIHVVAEDLLVVRDFARCIRGADRTPHDFKKGVAHKLALSWNQESTRFSIDGKDVEGFNLMVIDAFHPSAAAMSVGSGGDFEVEGLSLSRRSRVAVDPEDREFVRGHRCPEMASLFDAPSQEEYRGITFHRFPDRKTRDRIKRYVDILPPGMAASVGRVIFVEKGFNPDSSWKGMAFQGLRTLLVQETTGDDPSTFFHEVAHLYDYEAFKAHGQAKNQAWKKRFESEEMRAVAAERAYSALSQMDGSTSHEELAEFTGLVYGAYLKPSGGGFPSSREDKAKLRFLLEEGFISQAVYDKLMPGGH